MYALYADFLEKNKYSRTFDNLLLSTYLSGRDEERRGGAGMVGMGK